jgi:hypothetical protein
MKVAKTTMHEQTVLKNLLKMYCYEWSQYNKLAVNADGEFAFETHASDYWTKEGYHAYLIAVGENWAGFVLFDNAGFIVHKNYDYSMAEFFVLYPYRCSGVGSYVPPPFSIRLQEDGRSDAIRRMRLPCISGKRLSTAIRQEPMR